MSRKKNKLSKQELEKRRFAKMQAKKDRQQLKKHRRSRGNLRQTDY